MLTTHHGGQDPFHQWGAEAQGGADTGQARATHLHPEDAKDNEEGAADEDDVPNGPER